MISVRVELGPRSYGVRVGPGLLGRSGGLLAPFARAGRAVVVTDSNVGPLYARDLADSLRDAGVRSETLTFPAGEEHKDLATFGALADRLLSLSPPIDRQTLVVALGGGVTGDLAGFLAATALRGLAWANLPTTLLADVDASVGGKTGLDHPAGKNLIGAFHQPRAVLIDTALLRTLGRAQLCSGLAECVKHAVIADAALLELIEDQAEAYLAARPEPLAELIARNVEIKAAMVGSDEREAGRRALLNLGHTVGHALETAAGYGNLTHGQAVAVGMAAAMRIAVRRGLLEAQAAERVERLLVRLELPVRLSELPALPPAARDVATLLELMQRDKKARAGVVRVVLPTSLGAAAVFDDITPDQTADALAYIGATGRGE